MSKNVSCLDKLDDRAVLRILSHLTEQLREELPEGDRRSISSEDEARQAVHVLLTEAGVNAPETILPEEAGNAALARRFLKVLLDDPEICPMVEALVINPPDDEQRSIELAIAGAVILGGLITWLQTKMNIDVHRKDGNTEFRFQLRKNSTKSSVIQDTAKQIAGLLLR
jgi:hypothetical protein